MSDAPSFPLYANDFLGGRVATYSLAEIGAYALLLAFDWNLNGLPTETGKLAKLCRVSHRKFLSIWSVIGDQFPEMNGRRYNPRLALERAKKGVRSHQAREAAAMRWQNDRSADASVSLSENDATTTSTSTSSLPGTEVVSNGRDAAVENVATKTPDMSVVSALVSAANKGLAEHLSRPQPVPRLLPTQGTARTASEEIIEAGVPIDFAECAIYELAKAHNADGEVRSLKYFVSAVIRRWSERVAHDTAGNRGVPPRTNTQQRIKRASTIAGGGARNDEVLEEYLRTHPENGNGE